MIESPDQQFIKNVMYSFVDEIRKIVEDYSSFQERMADRLMGQLLDINNSLSAIEDSIENK